MVPELDDIADSLESQDEVASSASTKEELELSGPARYYCRKIKDRFPFLDTRLVERLGMASWERHKKVRKTLGGASSDKFLPHSYEQSVFHDSGLGTTLKTASEFAASQSSFQSFMSSKADIAGGHLRLPPLPMKDASGKAFLCTICGSTVRGVNNKVQWRHVFTTVMLNLLLIASRHHVYSDLQAYSCIVTDCDTRKSFTSRGEFAAHLAGAHRFISHWHCKSCEKIKPNKADFERHIELAHPNFPRPYVKDIIKASEKQIPRNLEHELCLFCGKTPTASRFIGHVSHHLEELSLSAIPQEVQSDSEIDSVGSSTTNSDELNGPVQLTGPLGLSNATPKNQDFSNYLKKPFPLVTDLKDQSSSNRRSRKGGVELDEEGLLLLKLKDEENLPWRDIAIRFQTDLGKSYEIPALQMRYKRLRERTRTELLNRTGESSARTPRTIRQDLHRATSGDAVLIPYLLGNSHTDVMSKINPGPGHSKGSPSPVILNNGQSLSGVQDALHLSVKVKINADIINARSLWSTSGRSTPESEVQSMQSYQSQQLYDTSRALHSAAPFQQDQYAQQNVAQHDSFSNLKGKSSTLTEQSRNGLQGQPLSPKMHTFPRYPTAYESDTYHHLELENADQADDEGQSLHYPNKESVSDKIRFKDARLFRRDRRMHRDRDQEDENDKKAIQAQRDADQAGWNAHQADVEKPLYECPIPGCDKLRFEDADDIRTHQSEMHDKQFFCSVEDCPYSIRGFHRIHNLLAHQNNLHGGTTETQ